ncbi:outer membrane protein, adhesin transport system [Desulfomicrobium apsheronum]|uniref:Outer membrane protein, adhesin transport system n=2 Tax=Desulfomicrobium apsheronum TaxID=52560 RepID=A0A1I4ACR4_9BACT|nr:outer membrane protein, adhesin transport system [Desulfomicrobium apsheronum]
MKGKRFVHHGMFWPLVVVFLSPMFFMTPCLMAQESAPMIQPLGAPGVDSVLEGVSAGGDSLKASIQSAMDANPKFLSRKHAYSISHDAYRESYGALLPQLDFMARGGYGLRRNDTTIAREADGQGEEWSDEQRLVLSQLLYDGGLTRSKVEADKLYSESKKEELFNTAEDVGLSATQYFLDVIRARGLVELCVRNIEEHEKLLDLTRIRQESGGGTQADVTQAEAALQEARSRLIQANQALDDAEAGYARFFGDKPGVLSMPEPPLLAIPQSEPIAIGMARDGNRALKAARLAVQQKELEIKSAKGVYFPRLHAKVAAGRSDNTGGYEASYHDASAMLEVNFNLYRGGSDAASIRKSKNEKLRAEQDALDIERQVEEDVRTAYSFFKATGKLLPVLRNLTNENAQVVSSYTDQFRMGQRTLVDLVSAQKSLFSSQQVYLNGMTAHTFSYYRLCMPVSQLMSALGVDLKVKGLGEITGE